MILTMGKTQVGTTFEKEPTQPQATVGSSQPTTGQLVAQWFGQQGQQLGAQTVEATGDRIAHAIRGDAPSSAGGGAGVVVVQGAGAGVPAWLAPVAIGSIAVLAIAVVATRKKPEAAEA